MFTETSFGKNAGDIKEESSLIDLDIGIGKFCFSPVPYESSRVRADESSKTMFTSDVLVDGLPADFDSIKFAMLPEPKNDMTNNTIATGSTWVADPPGQRSDEGKYTSGPFSCDFARTTNPSRNEHGEAEVVDDIGNLPKLNNPLTVYKSSQRKSVHNSTIDTEFQNPPRNCGKTPKKNSALDVNSLKISRRRRSLIPKQARSSVWGFLGNISPDFKGNTGNDPNVGNQNKLRRVIGSQGKEGDVTEKTDRKSFQKSHPTGHITLKIKIGNQSCGMVRVAKDLNASEKSAPDLSEIMERKFGERPSGAMALPHERTLDNVFPSGVSGMATRLDVRGTAENSSFTMSSDLHQIISHEEGDNMRPSIENRCLDTGTSPDSEVINSVPDATLLENSLQNMQGPPTMPMDRISQECFTNSVADVSFRDVSCLSFPQKKSTKGKKKDKRHELGDCSMENQLIGAKFTSSAKTPFKLEPGPKAVDVSFCNDVTIIGTAKTHPNTHSGNGVSKCPSRFSKMSNSGIPSTASKVSNGAEVILSPGLVALSESSNSQASDTLIPCSNGHKLSKCPMAKEQPKSRYEILDITSKKDEASKKKSDKNNLNRKHQIDEKADASGASNGAERHMVAGNKTSSDLGETGYISKGLSEPLNSLELSSAGLTEKYAPPRNAWVLCDECRKWRRIPATLADQIEETNSGWTCKNNTDTEFAECSIPQELSNSEINKELEISDVEEDAHDILPTSNQNRSKAVQQPSSWSLIKSNLFLHRTRKTQTIDEVMVCHCKPPLDGKTGCGAKCLNRMLNIECVRGTCPCGELCSNQQFQKRKNAKLKWFRCGKKGFGIQALEDISHGKFLIEYVGEVLDIRAYEGRQKEYALEGHKHFYFMTLNGNEVIDACAKGNLGRFINHSCDPNCRTEKWMVKGEVCVGLFAVRDIKKGEEVTFDYNYVRVFGAAAKKCVCGAPNCRGYIGGDPTNSEVVLSDSDDEFAEPVMTCDEGEMKEDWNDIISNSLPGRDKESATELPKIRDRRKKLVDVSAQLEGITSEALTQKDDGPEKLVGDDFDSHAAVRPLDTKKINGEPLSISASVVYKVDTEVLQSLVDSPVLPVDISSQSEDVMNDALLSSAEKLRRSRIKTPALPHKSQANTIESKRKLKYDTLGGKEEFTKPSSVVKARPPSIKKVKLKSNLVNSKGIKDVDKPNTATNKSKHLPDASIKNHVETVEEKLNELLDTEGGISKRKDASRGYLKLLFLTATSGTNGHGEATIQSTRDLSMILDAFLKTKSRTVLVDIINKNGLQMLHNIMKRYRKQFTKTPILRKLLKVLEYLAMREILTLEHITGGPPCPGVESFIDSILALTEHGDKLVHQTARNFRDRFIPRYLRRKCFPEMEASRLSISPKPTENRTRKRKSRWDNPIPPHFRIKTNSENDDSTPPGFCQINTCAFATVLGDSQPKFVASISVSYGIPYYVMRQFGIIKEEDTKLLKVAPGVPFHPFPPLPGKSAEKFEQANNNGCSSSIKRSISPNVKDNLGSKCFRQQDMRFQ